MEIARQSMETRKKGAKLRYYSNIIASFGNMRNSEFICDFAIKVYNESFPVHRALLAAASKYFEAMFSSEMEEVKNGYVVMKDISTEAVKQCIQFIYTGEAELSMSLIVDTLYASHLMQLDILSSLCFDFMEENLSTNNCFSNSKLSQFYGCMDFKIVADQYVVDNFEMVTFVDEFLQMSKEELIFYVSQLEEKHLITWQAVKKWISGNNEDEEHDLHQLLKRLHFEKFPFKFLLETVLEDSMVQNSETARNFVVTGLLSDLNNLRENLSIATLFHIRKVICIAKITRSLKKTKKIVNEFMAVNFEQLVQKPEFTDLESEEILHLFQSSETKYSTEKIKWEAALKWVKYDHRRIKVFPSLFKCIKFDEFYPEFIQRIVRTETLVDESRECKELLLNVVYARGEKENIVPRIAYVNGKTGKIKVINLTTQRWSQIEHLNLKDVPYDGKDSKIVNVNEELYVYGSGNLSVLHKDRTWSKKAYLRRFSHDSDQIIHLQGFIYIVHHMNMVCYDIATDTWSEKLPACGLSKGFCAIATDECIYAMGGVYSGNKAKKYDAQSQTWTIIAPMPYERRFSSANVLDGMVFVLGGFNDRIHPTSTVQCYNPFILSWTEVPSMCSSRAWLGSCVVNNNLYAIGGSCNKNYRRKHTDSLEVYNKENGTWEVLLVMESDSTHANCCSFTL